MYTGIYAFKLFTSALVSIVANALARGGNALMSCEPFPPVRMCITNCIMAPDPRDRTVNSAAKDVDGCLYKSRKSKVRPHLSAFEQRVTHMESLSRALLRGLVRRVVPRPIASAVLPARLGGKVLVFAVELIAYTKALPQPIPRLGIWRDYKNTTCIPGLDLREQYFLKVDVSLIQKNMAGDLQYFF